MEHSNGAYTSLDPPSREEDRGYAWWWRAVALASSWMILLGFLSLPPLFEDHPKLRISETLLSILTVAMLVGGFALTALLSFVCSNWQYLLDVVFFPGLCSSSLGLLAILYNIGISERYHWRAGAIVGTVVGLLASFAYLALCILAYRRVMNPLAPSSPTVLSRSAHRLRNLIPHRKDNPRISVSGEAPVEIITGDVSTEDELTRQQMLNLLRQRDNLERRQSEASLRSTYNIEIPQVPRQAAGERLAMPQHVQEYYSPLNPNAPNQRRIRTESGGPSAETSRQSTLVPGITVGPGLPPPVSRDRSRSREARQEEIEHGDERARSRSRDIRRQEIEHPGSV